MDKQPSHIAGVTPPRRLSIRKRLAFSVLTVTTFCAFFYLGVAVGWSYVTYRQLKLPRITWCGRVHQSDPYLGYAAVPGSKGRQLLPGIPDVSVCYDEAGFRVPAGVTSASAGASPRILALGCSFTYGFGCRAEDAYPYRLAESIHASALNAAKPTYGLAHMVVQARQLVPIYKPRLVLVQYSKWLLPRARTQFQRSSYVKMTGPYFYHSPKGGLEIHEPVFEPFDADLEAYSSGKPGIREFVSFACREGVPLRIHDDFGRAFVRIENAIGVVPIPCAAGDRDAMIRATYGAIDKVCREAGAQMLIVVINSSHVPYKLPDCLLSLGVPIVRADQALVDRLPEKTAQGHSKTYTHWQRDPPRRVDGHPNARAHGVIADCVKQALHDGGWLPLADSRNEPRELARPRAVALDRRER